MQSRSLTDTNDPVSGSVATLGRAREENPRDSAGEE